MTICSKEELHATNGHISCGFMMYIALVLFGECVGPGTQGPWKNDKQFGLHGYIKNGSQWLVPCPRHRLIPVGCPVQVMHRLGPEGVTVVH